MILAFQFFLNATLIIILYFFGMMELVILPSSLHGPFTFLIDRISELRTFQLLFMWK